MSDILKEIIAYKESQLAAERAAASPAQLLSMAAARSDHRDFQASLLSRKPGVIAEIKKASPSKGLIRADFHPAQIAQSYESAGAACLSVLTETHWFLGSSQYLKEARAACSLPVLRKDFITDEYQVLQAAAWGADAILLIAAALEPSKLKDLAQAAFDLKLSVLIESHDEAELERSLLVDGALIGINNRNLRTFKVDLQTTIRLSKLVPEGVPIVTESGIRSREDVAFMRERGIESFLVGEAFMREADPGAALDRLFGLKC